MAGPSQSKHVNNKRHHSEWIMIMKCHLDMNAFSNDRLIIARDLIGVSFAAVPAGVTQCSRPQAWTFILRPVHIKNIEFWTCCVKNFGPGWTGILNNTSFIWSNTDKHAECIYYFQNVFSSIKTQTWCFYYLWSWNIPYPHMIFTCAWASHAHRAWQISFSPSLQMFRLSMGSWSL